MPSGGVHPIVSGSDRKPEIGARRLGAEQSSERRLEDRPSRSEHEDAIPMLYTLAVILLVLWLLGFFAFHVGGGLIHLLLVIAVIVVIYQLVTGRRVL
jgi:hypothetical protein